MTSGCPGTTMTPYSTRANNPAECLDSVAGGFALWPDPKRIGRFVKVDDHSVTVADFPRDQLARELVAD